MYSYLIINFNAAAVNALIYACRSAWLEILLSYLKDVFNINHVRQYMYHKLEELIY